MSEKSNEKFIGQGCRLMGERDAARLEAEQWRRDWAHQSDLDCRDVEKRHPFTWEASEAQP